MPVEAAICVGEIEFDVGYIGHKEQFGGKRERSAILGIPRTDDVGVDGEAKAACLAVIVSFFMSQDCEGIRAGPAYLGVRRRLHSLG